MPGEPKRDEYLDAMAARLDDPDAYVRYLAEKLSRAAREPEPDAGAVALPHDAGEDELTARGRWCDR